MEVKQAIQILKNHNLWRKGEDEELQMTDPKKLGIAIDTVVNKFENLFLSSVVSSYVYIITFYDYDHDVIKHTFTDEQTAIKKHKELQENRTWGFYNLHKKLIE